MLEIENKPLIFPIWSFKKMLNVLSGHSFNDYLSLIRCFVFLALGNIRFCISWINITNFLNTYKEQIFCFNTSNVHLKFHFILEICHLSILNEVLFLLKLKDIGFFESTHKYICITWCTFFSHSTVSILFPQMLKSKK